MFAFLFNITLYSRLNIKDGVPTIKKLNFIHVIKNSKIVTEM